MFERGAVIAATAMLVAICSVSAGRAADPQDFRLVDGACTPESHVAEGRIGEDLTKRQSRFFCDAVAIERFRDFKANGHAMIQFTEKESNHEPPIGFAGHFESDGQIMDVDRVYLAPNQATPVTEGACKLFFTDHHMKQVFCGAKIDEGDRRTVPIVGFEVAPGR